MKRALALWAIPLICLVLIVLLVGFHSHYASWFTAAAPGQPTSSPSSR